MEKDGQENCEETNPQAILFEAFLRRGCQVSSNYVELNIIGLSWVPAHRAGGGTPFFQVILARYERGPVIITSNKGVGEWGEYLSDPTVAAPPPGPLSAFMLSCHLC